MVVVGDLFIFLCAAAVVFWREARCDDFLSLEGGRGGGREGEREHFCWRVGVHSDFCFCCFCFCFCFERQVLSVPLISVFTDSCRFFTDMI